MTQAQAESDLYDGGALVQHNYGPIGYTNYWYSSSSSMTGEMCVSSCQKYGFTYAAINP